MSTNRDRGITALIEEKTGINTIPISELNMDAFIARRISEAGCNASDYLSLIKRNKSEFQALVDFVTINETYFFREEKSFRFLNSHVVPALVSRGGTVNVLSAGCSTGEEPLSLYALLMDALPERRFAVYAADINRHVLDHFRKGVYGAKAIRNDGREYHHLLEKISQPGKEKGAVVVDQKIIQSISISHTNLFDDSFDFLPLMDLILLKNTLIYMKSQNKHKIIDKFTKRLKVGGILITSAAEVALISHPQLQVEERHGYFYLIKKDPRTLDKKELLTTLKENSLNRDGKGGLSLKADYGKENLTAPLQKCIGSENHPSNLPAGRIKNEAVRKVPEERDVCLRITDILNNRCSREEEGQLHRSAESLVALLYQIDSGDIPKAEELFIGLQKNEIPPSLYDFMGGFIALQKENMEEAASSFRSCLKENPQFWPARYLSLSCRENQGRVQISQLKILIDHIDDYIKQNRIDYQFLLEGFNARYFLEICKTRLVKIEKGTFHAHR